MKPFYWISKMMYILILILNIKDGVADNFSSLRLRKARNLQQTKTTSDCEIISEAIQSLGLKLDQSFKTIEYNMMERMSKLDDKVNLLHDKMFKENILTSSNRMPRPETESIESKIELIEQQMDNIKAKLNGFVEMIGDKLLNNNHKTSEDDSKSRNVNSIVEAASEEMITRFNGFNTAIDEMNRKIQQNKNLLMQNYGELMTIAEHLNNKKNDNSSVLTQQNDHRIQQQQQQQKKERVFDHSMLINEILRMVRNRLSGDNSENENMAIKKLPVLPADSPSRRINVDDAKYSSSTLLMNLSPIRDDELKSQLSEKIISRKDGIVFPSIKNKPSNVNTTFTTDTLAYKDIKGFSCTELMNAGMRQSGVYYLQIRGTTYWFLKVFCEQEIADGGWTVIQRRDDFGEPRENFNRDWADYKNGFGDPAKEFWMGNENIYMLTNNEDYALRIELEDFEGNKRYAQYSHFKVNPEADYYKLEIDGYEGNAGDSLNDPWHGSNNSPFSTYNRDNDRSSLNCASMLKGGWWWKSCGRGLNGPGPSLDSISRGGIVWFQWNGYDYALKKTVMMMKPISKVT
ncbi:hypothetical protein ACKWTF_006186 [Chironomus riparius]